MASISMAAWWREQPAIHGNTYRPSTMIAAQPSDADRPRKYLARFGVSWQSIREK